MNKRWRVARVVVLRNPPPGDDTCALPESSFFFIPDPTVLVVFFFTLFMPFQFFPMTEEKRVDWRVSDFTAFVDVVFFFFTT